MEVKLCAKGEAPFSGRLTRPKKGRGGGKSRGRVKEMLSGNVERCRGWQRGI